MSQLGALSSLDLSRNWLRNRGVVAVAYGCSHLPALTHLHCGVAVGDADLAAARKVLGEHVHMEMLGGSECNEWVMESWQVQD